MLLGDPDVGGRGKFQPAAQRVAVENGNDGLAQPCDRGEGIMSLPDPEPAEIQRLFRAPGVDVPARRKGFSPAPVIMTARMSELCSILRQRPCRELTMRSSSAFSLSARSIVTIAIGPSMFSFRRGSGVSDITLLPDCQAEIFRLEQTVCHDPDVWRNR